VTASPGSRRSPLVAGFFLTNNMVGDVAGGGARRAIGRLLPGFDGPLQDREIPFDLIFPEQWLKNASYLIGTLR
jgi:hypothetical protein